MCADHKSLIKLWLLRWYSSRLGFQCVSSINELLVIGVVRLLKMVSSANKFREGVIRSFSCMISLIVVAIPILQS